MKKVKEFFQPQNLKSWSRDNLSAFVSVLGLLVCILIFTITTKGKLWSSVNLSGITEGVAVYFILALGAVFIYSMGYMDVSLGNQLAVYGILMILILDATKSVFLALLVAIVLALICGVINGCVSVFLKLPSIVTSIFLTSIFTGLQYILVEKITTSYAKPSNSVKFLKYSLKNLKPLLNMPITIALLIVFAMIASYVFYYTRLGKYVKSIGANEVTTAQCGVNTTLWKTLGYSALGLGIAIAALFNIAKTGTVSKDTGSGYAMNVMLCLILGGMPLNGGMKSKVRCAAIGSLTYVILSKGLNLTPGLNPQLIPLFNALIFLVVVIITSRSKSEYLPR